jgi:hypothetical protein
MYVSCFFLYKYIKSLRNDDHNLYGIMLVCNIIYKMYQNFYHGIGYRDNHRHNINLDFKKQNIGC